MRASMNRDKNPVYILDFFSLQCPNNNIGICYFVYILFKTNFCSSFLSFQLIAIKEDIKMRVILLSLMMVCLFGYHAKACGRRCEGFAEIRLKNYRLGMQPEKSIERISVNQSDDLPKKVSEMTGELYNPRYSPEVTIEVEGNCCWKFYER